MKLVLVTVCALIAVAACDDPTVERPEQCAICTKYFALLTTNQDQANNIPIEFDIFEEPGQFEKLCLGCDFDEQTSEEADISEIQDSESSDQSQEDENYGLDTTNLFSLTNCKTCKEIVSFTANNTLNFSYQAIKVSLSHACSSHKIKLLDDSRCRLFISMRREKIIRAIFRYHMDATGTCMSLDQC